MSEIKSLKPKQKSEKVGLNSSLPGTVSTDEGVERFYDLSSFDNRDLAYCERCRGLFFLNKTTGEFVNARCNCYKCDYCGPRKARILQNALRDYLSGFSHIRLFTFTVRTNIFNSPDQALARISEIWRRFIISLRRHKSLSSLQQNFSYIKVLELTKRGYPHFHVFITEFLPYKLVHELWNRALGCPNSKKFQYGGVNIEHSFSAKTAADYVSKYIVKTARDRRCNKRLWSRSGGVRIFERRESSGEWQFINLRFNNFILSSFCVSSQNDHENLKQDPDNFTSEGFNIKTGEYCQSYDFSNFPDST